MNSIVHEWFGKIFLIYLFFLPLVPRFVGLELGVGTAPFISVLRVGTTMLLFLWFIWMLLYASKIRMGFKINLNNPFQQFILLLCIYMIVVAISVFMSRDVKSSIKLYMSEYYLIGFLMFLLFCWIFQRKNTIDAALKTWIVSSIIVLVVGLVEFVMGASIFNFIDLPGRESMIEGFFEIKERAGFLRIQSTLDNPVVLSVYLLMTIPIVGYFYNQSRTVERKIVYGILIWLLVAVIILTFVRSAWLLTSVTIVILFGRKYIYGAISIVIILFLMFISEVVDLDPLKMLDNVINSVVLQEERQVSKSTDYRIEMLVAGYNTLKKSPVFGVGPGNFGSEVEGDYQGELTKFEHHENNYITAIVETGYLGFSVYILMLYGVLRSIWKKRKAEVSYKRKSLYSVVLLSICNYIIMGFFLDSFSYFQISFLFWLLVAIAMMIDNESKSLKYIYTKNI